jgi:hypothetical protein
MARSHSPVALTIGLLGLFLGGAAAGVGVAGILAPDSWLAETVSFITLPLAFAAGLQAWYGLALFSLIPRLLGWVRGSSAPAAGVQQASRRQLPGSFVFLPLSSGAGVLTGIHVGLVSSAYPVWFIVLVYWLMGTVHGLLAWRSSRPIYGRMFWFSRKKFVGSYLRLSARSRSYLASP